MALSFALVRIPRPLCPFPADPIFSQDKGCSAGLAFEEPPSPAPLYGVATMREVARWPAETLIPHLMNSSLGVAAYAFFLATLSEEQNSRRVFSKDELRSKNRLFFGVRSTFLFLVRCDPAKETSQWLEK